MSAAFTPQDYQDILAQLAGLSDEQYKSFHQGLVPGVVLTYGVRVPKLRQMARAVIRQDPVGFLAVTRPGSYEENMIRGLVIAGMKLPMEERLPLVESFLPLIDNWAVCDIFCGGFFLKKPEDRALMWAFLQPLFRDSREYYARFAAVMLLSYYVDPEHIAQDLALLEAMSQEPYYVRMAVAWALSVCYVKFPGETLPLLQRQSLAPFTQNKTIQKIRESRRVSPEDKAMLNRYKVPMPRG